MNPLTPAVVAMLASLSVTRAAPLTYEVTGQLTEVSFDSPRLVGTPFTLRFTYSTDSLQTAEIWGDFPAPTVFTSGEFFLGSQALISFREQPLWYYTAYSSFWLYLGVPAYTAQPPVPTVTPEFSYVHITLPSPDGFLPDGTLFDDSTPSISTFGNLTFDYRPALTTGDYGRGEIQAIRLVPEPAVGALVAAGLLVFAFQKSRLQRKSHDT